MAYILRSARWIASDVLHQVIEEGDTVIDATLGNGHDTVMLAEPDKKKGRAMGDDMMELFRQKMPRAYEMAVKQYHVYRMMNRLHVRKASWDKILNSRIYNTLRNNHDFS